MKQYSLFSKIEMGGLSCVAVGSLGVSAFRFFQPEPTNEIWQSLARTFGMGAIGILAVLAVAYLIGVINKRPSSSTTLPSEMALSIAGFNSAITLMNQTTHSDHERMLEHDKEFLRRMETIINNETAALNNHAKIIDIQLRIMQVSNENYADISKRLDAIEKNLSDEGRQ